MGVLANLARVDEGQRHIWLIEPLPYAGAVVEALWRGRRTQTATRAHADGGTPRYRPAAPPQTACSHSAWTCRYLEGSTDTRALLEVVRYGRGRGRGRGGAPRSAHGRRVVAR